MNSTSHSSILKVHLVEFFDLLSVSLLAADSWQEALNKITPYTAEPLRASLQRFREERALGVSLDQALDGWARATNCRACLSFSKALLLDVAPTALAELTQKLAMDLRGSEEEGPWSGESLVVAPKIPVEEEELSCSQEWLARQDFWNVLRAQVQAGKNILLFGESSFEKERLKKNLLAEGAEESTQFSLENLLENGEDIRTSYLFDISVRSLSLGLDLVLLKITEANSQLSREALAALSRVFIENCGLAFLLEPVDGEIAYLSKVYQFRESRFEVITENKATGVDADGKVLGYRLRNS